MRALLAEELAAQLRPIHAALRERAQPQPPPDAMLDSAAVAKLLGIDRRTLRRMVKAREVPAPMRLGRRALRWRRAEIEAWIAREASRR
jgi:prophage regulatory protein